MHTKIKSSILLLVSIKESNMRESQMSAGYRRQKAQIQKDNTKFQILKEHFYSGRCEWYYL